MDYKERLQEALYDEALLPSDLGKIAKDAKKMDVKALRAMLVKISDEIDKVTKRGGRVPLTDPLSKALNIYTQELKKKKNK